MRKCNSVTTDLRRQEPRGARRSPEVAQVSFVASCVWQPMGYIINSNNLEDLHVMMFERYKVFTIGSRGGGVVGARSSIFSNYGSLPRAKDDSYQV